MSNSIPQKQESDESTVKPAKESIPYGRMYSELYTDWEGYEKFTDRKVSRENEKISEGTGTILIHRLAAVAWFGYDAVAENVIHHKLPIEWVNIEANLEPMDNAEHINRHWRIEAKPYRRIVDLAQIYRGDSKE